MQWLPLLMAVASQPTKRPLFARLVPAGDCIDSHESCEEWAADGECTANPTYMLTSCSASCKEECRKPGPPKPKRSLSQQLAGRFGCRDEDPACPDLAALGGCLNGSDTPLRCPASCRACRFEKLVKEAFGCEDQQAECSSWAASGECTKNRQFMESSCAVSCGVCDKKRSACVRPPNTPPAVGPGGIEETMLRILRGFPQYSPKAISRPGNGTLGDKAPWVITLSNFVSDDEATAFIEGCASHFDRSLAGDQLSPVRTSNQCWCSGNKCERSALTKAVEARIANITNVPAPRYFEPFQILKYEPGQFYKVHHDQNSGLFTPQGPRVYTFFMYLSTPEKGGGTRFADLNHIVPAVKGNAVLWPSVMNVDPDRDEPKTNHEGLPPITGVKYASNVWVHQFDYRTPAARNCVLSHKNTH